MTESIFPKIPLNQAPDLTMADITRKLFDNDFLSDVKFSFKDNTIKSHSFELKKRSVTFEHKFPTIISTLYPAFYEVIRYIYTDECHIMPEDRIPMLKLAIKYKIPGLQTKLINNLTHCAGLDLFEYAQLGNYHLISNRMREWIQNELHEHLNCMKLEKLHPTLMEEILKFDYLQNFTEDKLFELLVRWINHQCEVNQIPSSLRRERFDKFIRLIRFQTMTIDQFANCINQDDELFTKHDILMIGKQIALGTGCTEEPDCNIKKRMNSVGTHRIIAVASRWETKFSVLSKIQLSGVRFGFCQLNSNFTIQIKGKNSETNTETISFKFDKSVCTDWEMVVSLGDEIILKPNFDYTIVIETSDGLLTTANPRDDRRPKLQDEFLNLSQGQIIRKKDNLNLLEIIYKTLEEHTHE